MSVELNAKPEEERLRFLELLARQYPTVQAASSEIVNLRAILNLPKGTEHFISDIHGEYEAFQHLMNSASGVVREKIDVLFGETMSKAERDALATLIYYPAEKLDMAYRRMDQAEFEEWEKLNIHRLIDLCRLVTSKYTRSKVRKGLPKEYAYVIEELLNTDYALYDKREQYQNVISTLLDTGVAGDFIKALCGVIKHMVVDKLHVVGDLFDRGPRADIVIDTLMAHHDVDIQWGNHDVLWLGAATGSRTLVATVLSNSIHYNNLAVIERGYGISLRPLALFATEYYGDTYVSRFEAKVDLNDRSVGEKDALLAARMYKAVTIIMLKLEGQKILRNPQFRMDDRLLLDKIDYEKKQITIAGVTYPLEDTDFPTVDRDNPYELSEAESRVIDELAASFRHSEKLQKHVRFLYSKGSMYKVINGNLLFHGCIPMTPQGDFAALIIDGKEYSGRALMDYCEAVARQGYYAKPGTPEREYGMDFLWYLWEGRSSPLFGREKMTTFERRLIGDKAAWEEPKDPYYKLYQDPAVCDKILKEFGLEGPHCHIINGHVPVKSSRGESPVKGEGRLIVIDGGFCRAYQPTTGIAGYTLIYNSHGCRIVAHQPFVGRKRAIAEDLDITSDAAIIDSMDHRVKIRETDMGARLQRQADDLMELLAAFRSGAVSEDHRS